MNSTLIRSSANYKIIIPIFIAFSSISVSISCGILILIYSTKRLHTITHLLICNTCFSSILYSIVQGMNYIYLLFFPFDTSDLSCRYRAYFGYVSIASVIYSYFLQALSRYFFSKFPIRHRSMLSFRMHSVMILVHWIIVMLIPLPTLLTNDIYYRPTFLCWVPKEKLAHALYTLFAYYLIPVTLIVGIYVNIFIRVRSRGKTRLTSLKKIHQHRNLEILRNILLLIGIYTSGGIPTLIYITTRIEIFYSIGMIFLSLTVTIERLTAVLLDRELRNLIKNYFYQKNITTVKQNHKRRTVP